MCSHFSGQLLDRTLVGVDAVNVDRGYDIPDIACGNIVGSGLEEFDASKRRYQQQHLGIL